MSENQISKIGNSKKYFKDGMSENRISNYFKDGTSKN